MTWKDSFAIGVPEIDRQHKALCDKIDDLFAACSGGKGGNEVVKTLDFLTEYTIKHFADEEKLQQKVGYPGFSRHKALHNDFTAQVLKLKKELAASGHSVPMVINVNNVISTWLINHIMKEDKQLKEYMK
jgi:hemerythrin-like metal-binding domain